MPGPVLAVARPACGPRARIVGTRTGRSWLSARACQSTPRVAGVRVRTHGAASKWCRRRVTSASWPSSLPAVLRRDGKREEYRRFLVPAPGVPPLARGGTGAAGPHGPHNASVKVSDASASAEVEEGEVRVRLRSEQVLRRFLRGCFHPLVITWRDGPRGLLRHYGIVQLDGARHSGGLRNKAYPSIRFRAGLTIPSKERSISLLRGAKRRNGARQRCGDQSWEVMQMCINFLVNEKLHTTRKELSYFGVNKILHH